MAEAADGEVMSVESPKTMLDLLRRIRQSPGMWLGHETLQGLRYFLLGTRAVTDYFPMMPPESVTKVNDFPWREFEAFVEKRHGVGRPRTLGSFGLAQFIAQGETLTDFPWEDHPGAWELWWQWFDEFMESQNRS